MYKPPQNSPSCFRCVVFFRFKLFEERVVQGSQVFVNEEIMVHLRTIDAQLFFCSEQKHFKSLMRQCDHHRVRLRHFGNVDLIIDFTVWHIKLFLEKLFNTQVQM